MEKLLGNIKKQGGGKQPQYPEIALLTSNLHPFFLSVLNLLFLYVLTYNTQATLSSAFSSVKIIV